MTNCFHLAIPAGDIKTALGFYERLIDLGYTGISINYYAIEKESGKEQVFQDEKSRDFSVDVLLVVWILFVEAEKSF